MVARVFPSVSDPSRNCTYCHQVLQGDVVGHEDEEGAVIHNAHEECMRLRSYESLYPVCPECHVGMDVSQVFSYARRIGGHLGVYYPTFGSYLLSAINDYVVPAIRTANAVQDVWLPISGIMIERGIAHLKAGDKEMCPVPLDKIYALAALTAGYAAFHLLPERFRAGAAASIGFVIPAIARVR